MWEKEVNFYFECALTVQFSLTNSTVFKDLFSKYVSYILKINVEFRSLSWGINVQRELQRFDIMK